MSFPLRDATGTTRPRSTKFHSQYQQFKRFSKDVVLQPRHSADDLTRSVLNRFIEDDHCPGLDNELSDWVMINKNNNEHFQTPTRSKQGFLDCTFLPFTHKRRIKYLRHWVTLADHFLSCYQSKDSGDQIRYKKINLCNAILLNGHSYTGKKYSFRISATGEEHPYYFVCLNETEYTAWFFTISTTIKVLYQSSADDEPCNIPKVNEWDEIEQEESTNDSFGFHHVEYGDNNRIRKQSIGEISSIDFSDFELGLLDKNLERHLSKHPECSWTIISDHVHMILATCEEHSLFKKYRSAIQQWKDEHYFMVYTATEQDVLQKSTRVIKNIMSGIVNELLNYYQILSAFPQSPRACAFAVECVLFSDLYEPIFSMFKLCFKNDDLEHLERMEEFSSITPAHFGIHSNLWLLNDATHQMPYQEAVDVFKGIRKFKTPHEKANCLLETGNALCNCVSKYYQRYHPLEQVTLGGDDLLPLFAYVVIRSQVPNLFSEFRFIDEFLANMKGEVSYFLVTFCTSLSLIHHLDEETIIRWNDDPNTKANETQESNIDVKDKKLIDISLEASTEEENGSPRSREFLTWASSLLRNK